MATSSLAHVPTILEEIDTVRSDSPCSVTNHPTSDPFETCPNHMGLFCRYPNKPTINPDQNIGLQSCCDGSEFLSSDSSVPRPELLDPLPTPPPFGSALPLASPDEHVWSPFSNFCRAVFMVWHYNGGTVKSAAQTELLGKAVTDKWFNGLDMIGFSLHKENKNIDEYL